MDTTSEDRCEHEHAVRISTARSLLSRHRSSMVAELAAEMNRDEVRVRCQAECGEASPWHDVELQPVDGRAAAESLHPHGLVDEFVVAATKFGRRLLGRGAA